MTAESEAGTGRPPSEEDEGLRQTGGLRGSGSPPDALDQSGSPRGASGPGGGELRGEDLSKGPTPETRHPEGGVDDVRDTTEGPTPETRLADRQAEAAPHASGEPKADETTRGKVGGEQV